MRNKIKKLNEYLSSERFPDPPKISQEALEKSFQLSQLRQRMMD